MTPEIRPTQHDDLEELSQFLTTGFDAPADAEFAAPDVLRWKYLEPIGEEKQARSFIAETGGRIVGHVGICPTRFQGRGLPLEGVRSLHMIDWLGAREARGVGAALMRYVHGTTEAQYVLAANDQARRVTGAAGYEPVADIPLFRKVLRLGHRWKETRYGPVGRLLRVARDVGQRALRPEHPPRVPLQLCPVTEFRPEEVEPVVADAYGHLILTDRSPARLNHALRYPRPGMSGYLLIAEGMACGIALLNLVRRDGIVTGKLVECLVSGREVDLYRAAVTALARELAAQGADVITAFGSTPEMAEALRGSGFSGAGHLTLTLRDREQRIPREAAFYVSPFEADSAHV